MFAMDRAFRRSVQSVIEWGNQLDAQEMQSEQKKQAKGKRRG